MADIVEVSLQSKVRTKPLLTSQQKRFREVQMPDGNFLKTNYYCYCS